MYVCMYVCMYACVCVRVLCIPTRWNDQYLKSNNVKNSRNKQARLKTHEKNMKKEKRRQEAKIGKENMLKGFGEKLKRDRGEL
jgi:hypothetical protein